jgi:hypothetical protein
MAHVADLLACDTGACDYPIEPQEHFSAISKERLSFLQAIERGRQSATGFFKIAVDPRNYDDHTSDLMW